MSKKGEQNLLFSRIDRDGVVAMNEQRPGMGIEIIKPWAERDDETRYLESDADDQLIIRIPFAGQVKLRSLLLKAGPTDQTPSALHLYPNIDNLDFEDASQGTHPAPAQKLESIAVAREVIEYPLRTAKLSAVRSLTIFVPASLGSDTSRIYFLGLRGQWQDLRREGPTNIVYEAAPQAKGQSSL